VPEDLDDDVVDARTDDDVLVGHDPAGGDPTQAVPRFGDGELDDSSLFDDERTSTSTGGFERR
jgi:hypothetical protein